VKECDFPFPFTFEPNFGLKPPIAIILDLSQDRPSIDFFFSFSFHISFFHFFFSFFFFIFLFLSSSLPTPLLVIPLLLLLLLLLLQLDHGVRERRQKKKEKEIAHSSSPSYFCSLNNGEDILLRRLGWKSGRSEGYSQEESLSQCQLEE